MSMVNEYGETILQHFQTTDNHWQLRPVLEVLKALGLDPSIDFSDNPARDRRLFEGTQPSLQGNVDTSYVAFKSDASLPIFEMGGTLKYLTGWKDMTTALAF